MNFSNNNHRKTPWLYFSLSPLIIGAHTTHAVDDLDVNEAMNMSLSDLLNITISTGTGVARTAHDTPLVISEFDENKLLDYTSNSQADILRYIPGVKTEGGGGEVATNIVVSGLPSQGQYQFTPLLYDGIPSFSTFGLNSSAFDVYMRNDLGLRRLEFVSGGVSNLFGPGSIAGIFNYMSKTGEDPASTHIQYEVAEESRRRFDFATNGTFEDDSNNGFALSGYYRYDEGPIRTGLPSVGYQLRGNFRRAFADDSGYYIIAFQAIDDNVQFYLPFPIDGNSQERTTGNDGAEVFSVQTVNAENISYNTPDSGLFTTNIREGVKTKGGMLSFEYDEQLSEQWRMNMKTKYADYHHEFNFFLDGDALTNNVPSSIEDYIDARGFGTENVDDASNATFTFVDTGLPVPSNYLVFGNRIVDRERPATDFTFELDLFHNLEWGGVKHNFTFGTFMSRAEAKDYNVTSGYLADFSDDPRLINATITDVDGSLTGTPGSELVISNNGLTQSRGVSADNTNTALRTALYVADQIDGADWSFDAGIRFERMDGETTKISGVETVVDESPTLPSQLSTVFVSDSLSARRGKVKDNALAWALAGIYHFDENFSGFANFSEGFFFPQLRTVQISDLNETSSYNEEVIQQAEIGIKYRNDSIRARASAFYVTLDDRFSVTFVNVPNGGIREQVTSVATETYGFEASATWLFQEGWSTHFAITYQDMEYTEFSSETITEDLEGNEPERNPGLIANMGLNYDDENIDFSIFNNYVGEAFSNNTNTIEFDAYNVMGLNAGYSFYPKPERRIRIGLTVFNLLDEQGLTEGSPREGAGQVQSDFFVGRPILPRRFYLKVSYQF
ncbi:MAG: TonB-dependent receptor [Pseudomonadota bacterium]